MTKQEAIDLLDNLIGMIEDNHGSDYDSVIRMAIDALTEPDDIDPQPQWTPCSERLPKTEVLCCDKYGEMIIAYVYADDTSDTGFSAESETQCMYNCVAWQPLPEPWKESKDETN